MTVQPLSAGTVLANRYEIQRPLGREKRGLSTRRAPCTLPGTRSILAICGGAAIMINEEGVK